MRYLKSITTLSVFLLLSCSDDKKTTTDVSKAQAEGGNPPVEQNPETKPSAKELENFPAEPTTLADWIKDKRIYFSSPYEERIAWMQFTKEGNVEVMGVSLGTYTVEGLKISTIDEQGDNRRSLVFQNAVVSKGDKIKSTKDSQEHKVVLVEDINAKPQTSIEYDTGNPAELGQGALAKTLKNKRLHFGIHGFETNCVQFSANDMAQVRGDDELLKTVFSGQRIRIKGRKYSYYGGAFQFSRPAVEVGDKFMIIRADDLSKPYESWPVLVLKLEVLPSGGMADLITGKRIFYQPAGKAGWIQFNADGTTIDEYSYDKYLFWVNGLKASIPKNTSGESVETVTFNIQSLKLGDAITIVSDGKTHEAKITKVEPASRPVELSKEDLEKKAMEHVRESMGNISAIISSLPVRGPNDTQKNTLPEQWCDFFISKKVPLETFLSPQLPQTPKLKAALKQGGGKRVSHYAINKAMINRDWDLLHEQVLIFEYDLGWNGAGGMADALKYMETYKLKWIAVGHGDGSGRLVTKEELASLPWGTSQGK